MHIKESGVLKTSDQIAIVEYGKVLDNCAMYFKYDPATQPAALKDANAVERCCIKFKYEKANTTGEFVYMCTHAEFRCDIYTNWMLKNF